MSSVNLAFCHKQACSSAAAPLPGLSAAGRPTRRRLCLSVRAQGQEQGAPELVATQTRAGGAHTNGSSSSSISNGGSATRTSLPAVLEMLEGVSQRLSVVQSKHSATQSSLQALNAELQATHCELSARVSALTTGVDQLGQDMGRLTPRGVGGGTGIGHPTRSALPRSPYSSKLGRLLARELLARR